MAKANPRLVERTYQAMLKAIPTLKRRDGENKIQHAQRITRFFSSRWDRAPVTVRSWRNGHRRPKSDDRAFFRDLRKYGGERFRVGVGGAKRAMAGLDTGPTMEEFMNVTPTGYKASRKKN